MQQAGYQACGQWQVNTLGNDAIVAGNGRIAWPESRRIVPLWPFRKQATCVSSQKPAGLEVSNLASVRIYKKNT
jgi:hypothetical protein